MMSHCYSDKSVQSILLYRGKKQLFSSECLSRSNSYSLLCMLFLVLVPLVLIFFELRIRKICHFSQRSKITSCRTNFSWTHWTLKIYWAVHERSSSCSARQSLIWKPVMASGSFLFAAAGFELISILYADILKKNFFFFFLSLVCTSG